MKWLAVALVLACAGCSSSRPEPSPSGSAGPTATASATATGGATATSSGAGVQAVSAGEGPVGLAVDPAGALWVADSGSSQVSRVRAGRQDLAVSGVETPLRLLASGGVVWATAFGSGELVRISATGAVSGRLPVGKGAEGVAAGFGSVWVVAQDAGRVVRVDPQRVTVVDRVAIGVGARLVTTGLGSVWVSQFRDGRVLRVNPRTKVVARSGALCQGPQGLAVAAGAVWVTCTKDDVLLRLNPKTLRVTRRVPMPEAPDGIAVGPNNRLYVVSQAGPTLVTVDATSGAVRARQSLGEQPQLFDQANLDVAVAADGVWVSSFGENLVRRVAVAAA